MEHSKLSVKAMAFAGSLLWGGSVLLVGIASMIWMGYGQAFLDMAASIYPGYHATASIGSVVVGTLYALVDGAVGGALLAWLYNGCAGKCRKE